MIDTLIRPYFLLLPSDLASVAAAMVWGQKNSLSTETYEIFRVTGLVHLLVLSGQNITLLLGFFGGIEKKVGYKAKAILTIAIGAFYIALFADPPIVRAVVMASISSLATLFDAPVSGLYVFVITVFILISWHSEWIASVSFLLSIGATLGILLFYIPIRSFLLNGRRTTHPLHAYGINAVALSVSAQIFTTPILLFFFRELSLVSLPMNVAVAWIIEPIMVVGVLISILHYLYAPLSTMCAFILFGLLHIFLFIVRTGSIVAGHTVLHI